MLVWILHLEWDLWEGRSARRRHACQIDYLDPGIKTLSASLFKILLGLENDLVDAGGDLELGCLFCLFGIAWGKEGHAATIDIGDTKKERVKDGPRDRK